MLDFPARKVKSARFITTNVAETFKGKVATAWLKRARTSPDDVMYKHLLCHQDYLHVRT